MTSISNEGSDNVLNATGVSSGHGNMTLSCEERRQEFQPPECEVKWLRALGHRQARKWDVVNDGKYPKLLRASWNKSADTISEALSRLECAVQEKRPITEEQRWILDHGRFLRGVSKEVRKALKSLQKLPCVQPSPGKFKVVPRAYQITSNYLQASGCVFEEESFGEYLNGVQEVSALEMKELWALKPLLQLALWERLGMAVGTLVDVAGAQHEEGTSQDSDSHPPLRTITSLQNLSQMEWKEFFEIHCVVDRILRSDPSGAYPKMDFESRQYYRDAVSDLSAHTELSEPELARGAIICARRAQNRTRGMSKRAIERRSNVGYYLLDEGVQTLKRKADYRPPLKQKIKGAILEWPEVYYVVGVEFTTLAMVLLLLLHLGTIIPLIPGLLLLIPASQAAVGLMNHLTAWLVPPRRLPKLDFSTGIPEEFLTLVVVPSLLLNEKEVRHIVESLEVRYLGNSDPNLHFALLTDSPDAVKPFDEKDELVGLCSSLIHDLNAKYAGHRQGTFLHLHRNRVFNPQENTWMGWERKRGKLLDLNKLLLNSADNFPIKVGDLSVLPRVRYVITLDSDTRLPRDTAHKLVGALAHPLNRAVIDRDTSTVVEGYGILQPRVGISIESARKSRLASIYSGETGIDIYTQAVSDVYQDLFGEGSFTGKGIYEVDTFQCVLDNRFPSNALLSHDLIEGVYGRAGLVSDIEVIDDYPSHFSAYCRRMHRWVRGDWQILRWLFPRVPDSQGRLAPNPLTLLSRWKIFDNLRRSLIELNLFLLLLGGWFFFAGGPLFWTFITLALLLIPAYVQLVFSLLRIKSADNLKGSIKDRADNFLTGHLQVFVMLVFLAHEAFVMADAITRTLARLAITRRNLLEWETAAESEAGAKKKSAVEIYLALNPWFAAAVGLSLAAFRPGALLVASPVLVLWLSAGLFTQWINRPPRRRKNPLDSEDKAFLRLAALATWRYFREFSNADVNWLVPDRVQEEPAAVADKISPTNLGILLNARVAALQLGYLTVTEFIEQTEETLRSAKQLPRFRGHFLNWYDVRTLKPLSPQFVSTVDSGNLAAALWTLKQACLGLLKQPVVAAESWQGIRDHVSFVQQLLKGKTPPAEVVSCIQEFARTVEDIGHCSENWIKFLPRLESEAGEVVTTLLSANEDPGSNFQRPMDELEWWASESLVRIESLRKVVKTLMPWHLPEYEGLQIASTPEQLTLDSLPSFIAALEEKLENTVPPDEDDAAAVMSRHLRSHLKDCSQRATELAARLQYLAAEADQLLAEMDFTFLYCSRRKLLWIGYDIETRRMGRSYYDLLASEARTASFIAIAKGDIPQEAWFHLGRAQAMEQGKAVLVSWSGTMFEYLMPLLWMRSYSGTLLDQNMFAAIVAQQKYVKRRNIPWGISEAAYNVRDQESIYQYRAFGLPGLALDPNAAKEIVIAPYASFLALLTDGGSAVRNIRTMWRKGWFGRFGFYESVDYSTGQSLGSTEGELVRCWMAHHQGMSLIAVCNLLTHPSLQQWFHQEPRVMATELLLHEKVPTAAPEDMAPRTQPQHSSRQSRKKIVAWNGLLGQTSAQRNSTAN